MVLKNGESNLTPGDIADRHERLGEINELLKSERLNYQERIVLVVEAGDLIDELPEHHTRIAFYRAYRVLNSKSL